VLPPENKGCWVYLGEEKKTQSTPYSIYGRIFLDGKGVQATLSIVNLDKGKIGIFESNKEGEFSFNLLNLGSWDSGDRIAISAVAENAKGKNFLIVNGTGPNQKIEIKLAEIKPTISKKIWWPYILAFVLVLFLIGFGYFLRKRFKNIKKGGGSYE